MNISDLDGQAADLYRVFLLRLWREKSGPWHASLQAADATAPQRFADLDALIAYLQELRAPPPAAKLPDAE